jgi:hypothetical protein
MLGAHVILGALRGKRHLDRQVWRKTLLSANKKEDRKVDDDRADQGDGEWVVQCRSGEFPRCAPALRAGCRPVQAGQRGAGARERVALR